jgi:thiol-disulfide isomerase/thioredoxin
MNYLFLLTFLPLMCLARPMTTIKGKVTGSDGQPLVMAQVWISGGVGVELNMHLGTEDPFFDSSRVNGDGSYSISTDSLGGLRLWCTAVGYKPFNIPIVLEEATNLEIDLRLEPYQITPGEKGIEISYDFDDVTRGKIAYLKEAAPGVFSLELPTKKTEFRYRINSRRLHPLGVSVPYATHDSFEYYREGLYTTLIHPIDGKVCIVLDLSKADTIPKEASYEFADPKCVQARIADRYFKSWKEQERSDKALYDHMAAGGTYADFKYDWVPFAVDLKRDLDEAQDQLFADELVMEYLEMAVFSKNQIFSDQLIITEQNKFSLDKAQNTKHAAIHKTLEGLSALSPVWVFHNAIALQAAKYHPLKDAFVNRIIETHPSRPFQAYLTFRKFSYVSAVRGNPEKKRLFSRLVNDYRDTPVGKMVRQTINFPDSVKIGSPLPLFTFTDLENGSQIFSNQIFRGRYLLLCFWESWCPPCVEEIPHLEKAYEMYHPQGLEILSVSFEKPSAIRYFRSQHFAMPWNHTAVDEADQGEVALKFDLCWPETILIGPDGIVLDKLDGFGENALEEMMSKHLPAK